MRYYIELVERLRANTYTVEELSIILPQAADAIEELQSYADLYKELTEKGQTVARKLIDAYPKWISVEERPITEPGNYITMTNATGKNNGVIAQKFVKKTIRGKPVERWEWCGRISPWTVTHYMNFPDPPKEEK